MNYEMSVTVFICGDVFIVYDHVIKIEHKLSFLRIFLSNGDVKTYSADDDLTVTIRFNEHSDYPF